MPNGKSVIQTSNSSITLKKNVIDLLMILTTYKNSINYTRVHFQIYSVNKTGSTISINILITVDHAFSIFVYEHSINHINKK